LDASARGDFVGQALPPAAKKQQAGMLALQRLVEAKICGSTLRAPINRRYNSALRVERFLL
jgi:hypothetical protein